MVDHFIKRLYSISFHWHVWISVVKILWQNSLNWRVLLDYCSNGYTVHHVGKEWRQDQRLPDHIVSAFGKLRERTRHQASLQSLRLTLGPSHKDFTNSPACQDQVSSVPIWTQHFWHTCYPIGCDYYYFYFKATVVLDISYSMFGHFNVISFWALFFFNFPDS